ncbi:MAG: hypothetical protein LM514_01670, partial [Streptococcus sp.]|nr:hypothetical protein [Streptococcus sp.]
NNKNESVWIWKIKQPEKDCYINSKLILFRIAIVTLNESWDLTGREHPARAASTTGILPH